MPPRKRQQGSKPAVDEPTAKATTGNVKPDKATVSKQSSSRAIVVTVSLVLITISAGVYVYNFVDVEDIFDKLQTQYLILSGKEQIPPPASETAEKTSVNENKEKLQSEHANEHKDQKQKRSIDIDTETTSKPPQHQKEESSKSDTSNESQSVTDKESKVQEQNKVEKKVRQDAKEKQEKNVEEKKQPEHAEEKSAKDKTVKQGDKEKREKKVDEKKDPEHAEEKSTKDKEVKKEDDKEKREKKVEEKKHEHAKEKSTKDKENTEKKSEKNTQGKQEDTVEAKKSAEDHKLKDSLKKEDPNVPYKHAAITNKVDNKIRNELDRAERLIELNKPEDAIKAYDKILSKAPKSPRATYGKARALNKNAEAKRSNPLLEESINTCVKILDLPDVPKPLMIQVVRDCTKWQQFRGWSGKAADTLRRLLNIYPDEISIWNELGVQYMVVGRNEAAREVFLQVLSKDPDNGFAKVHMGFIIKNTDLDNEKAIPYLMEGIQSGEEGVIDGRFYFHLGDALYRVGRHDEAYDVYRDGAEKGIFLSMWQRSLYNVDTLTGRPWWTLEQTSYADHLKNLQKQWKVIRDEGLAQLDAKTGSFKPEEENLREKGDWKQFTLFQQGRKNEENCKKAPKTCALIEAIPDAAGCKRGQVKYSVMQPGVHVWPHCGPTNCRIRAHLGLVIPEGPRIRVQNDTRTWEEGKFIIFDDSFEHEVWHDGKQTRLVLIVDFWHPELTRRQKMQLSPI